MFLKSTVQIDCIYWEWDNLKGLYIINRDNFENIFSYYEIYKSESQSAQRILEDSNLFSIAKGLFESIIDSRRYVKKIALINRRGNFNEIDLPKIQQLIIQSQDHLNSKSKKEKLSYRIKMP